MKVFRRNKIAWLLILALAAMTIIVPATGALATSKAKPGETLYVNVPGGGPLNLRCAPNFNALIVTKYPAGTPVRVMAVCGDWYKVSVNYCVGYMVGQYLSAYKPQPAAPVYPAPGSASGIVKLPRADSRLNLRATPSRASTVLGKFGNGTPVIIYETISGWYRVNIGGINGYVMSQYVKVNGGTPTDNYVQVFNPNGGSFVNLRTGPGYGYAVTQTVKNNVLVFVLDHNGAWTKVEINGNVGYMNNAFLK